MKRIALLIPTLAVALFINALPSFAAEEIMGGEVKAAGEKDECLLVAKNCAGTVDSYQERIEKLQMEINKGTDVYTSEELRILDRKLDEQNKALNELTVGG